MGFNVLPHHAPQWRWVKTLVCLCMGLIVSGCDSGSGWTFETPITVEIKGRVHTYSLRAPFGAFLINQSSDIDYANQRVSGLGSTRMYWHVDSGEPLWLWLYDNGKALNDSSHTRVSVWLSTINAGIDVAKTGKKSYFDAHLFSSSPELRPVLQGLVWNDSASKYKSYDSSYYVIEKREPFDGSVIVCRDTADYCTLYGASLRDKLKLGHISILQDDVANWKQYQHLVQARVEEALIDVRPTEKPKPKSRWLFWRR